MRKIALFGLCLILAVNAFADVKREYKTASTISKMGTNTATSADYYSVDRQNSESTTKWTGGFMKTMTGGKAVESSVITRIDRDSIWTVDHKKKTYSAMSFAELREQIKKGMAQLDEAQGEEEPADTAGQDMYEWTLEDKSDENPRTIGGWVCRNAHVVATGVNKSDANDKVIITVDMWNSEEVPGAAEIVEYSKKYLAALGLDDLALTEGLMMSVYLYADKMKEVLDKAKNARGESVTSLIKVERNKLKGPNLAKAAKEGVANELSAKVPFGLGKKKKQEDAKPEYVLKTVFSSERELVSATTDAVDAAKFEVPEGYKLKK